MLVLFFILLGCMLLIGYMYFLAHDDQIRHSFIQHPNIPVQMGEFKIFFIADIHRRKIHRKTLKKADKDLDIVCIGGDLLEKGVPLNRVKRNIRQLKQWQVPLYFVWGNNDEETDVVALRKLLEDEGVIVLEDEIVPLVKNDGTIWIAGFQYEMYPEREKAMIPWQEKSDEMILLLTHKPSSYIVLEDDVKNEIDLVLAGHTHGGQIRLLGYGPYQKGGLSKINGSYLLITEGYGYTFLPFRLGTRAECHIITLTHESINA